MFFQVDLNSSKPVYQQLIDQVKFAVASGRLRPGERLPPIRELAVELRVNRNTIARVYAELEREHVVLNRAGQGCFVSERGSSLSRTEQRKQLTARLDELLAQAKLFGFSSEQTSELFTQRMNVVFSDDETDKVAGGKTK